VNRSVHSALLQFLDHLQKTDIELNSRITYSAITERVPLVWPSDARIALWVAPNIEHYEYLPALVKVRYPWPRTPHPDILGYGQRDYGNRVGVWRFFELMDRFKIKCTVSLSMAVLTMYPDIAREMTKREWEFMSHGIFNTRYHWNMTEEEERAEIEKAQQIHIDSVGTPFKGWFSPAASNTLNTPDLVAEAGISYICDFYHDDQPTEINVKSGRLISLPYSMEINDSIAWRRGIEAKEFARNICDTFDTLYAEGGRVMNIAIHPFIMGQPQRIGYLSQAFEHIFSHPGVWCATGSEIVSHYAKVHAA